MMFTDIPKSDIYNQFFFVAVLDECISVTYMVVGTVFDQENEFFVFKYF